MMREKSWKLWLKWMLVSSVGCVVGIVVFLLALFVTALSNDSLILMVASGVIGGTVVGVAVGALQWFVLRQYLYQENQWVLASTIAWAVSLVVGWAVSLTSTFWPALVIGTVVGVSQWYVLRRHVPRAGWWIFANLMGWIIAFRLLEYSWVGFAIAPGVVTGVALVWLLRQKYSTVRKRKPGLSPILIGGTVLFFVAAILVIVKAIPFEKGTSGKPEALQSATAPAVNCPQGRGQYSLDALEFKLYAADRIEALSSAYPDDPQVNANWRRHAKRVKTYADETDTQAIMQLWHRISTTDGFENEYEGIGLNPYLSSEQVMEILVVSKTDGNMYWLTCHLRRHPNVCAPEGDEPGEGGPCYYDDISESGLQPTISPTEAGQPTVSSAESGHEAEDLETERSALSSESTAISAGSEHVCALRSNGTVWCWGSNYYSQLGDGSSTNSESPVQVSGLDDVTAIDAGAYHTCALRSDGTIWCWGNNRFGEVGTEPDPDSDNPFYAPVPSPVAVLNLSHIGAISAGSLSSCALHSDTTVWCWGDNSNGELGIGSASGGGPTPIQVPGLTEIETLSVGGGSVCVVDSQRAALCWGWNAYGQLGDGTTRAQLTPVEVLDLADVSTISQGNNQHTCAVRSDGTVWCWGWNNRGQLGDGTTTDSSAPRQVLGLIDAIDVSVGWRQTCALRADGTVWCWGDGNTTPSQIAQLKDVVSISAGASQSCALLSDSTVWCWGDDLSAPVLIAGLP
jgi:alpha-tubulin suppressor-like RCC1 family protein